MVRASRRLKIEIANAARRATTYAAVITRRTSVSLPNGSRLSCGASAGGRKHPALRYELVGALTYASPKRRPRQLQALVRPQAEAQSSDNPLGWDHNLEGRRLFRWWTVW